MTDFLREQRLAPARRSKEVFEIGMSLLYPSGSLASEEHWNALEQLLIAALDVGRRDIAEWALQKLLQKFGKESTRVLRLYGLTCESCGELDEAKKTYDVVLELNKKANNVTNSTSAFAVKRLSAIAKATGNYEKALQVLENSKIQSRTLLELFPRDDSIYSEMVNLACSANRFDKAAHYCEELLLRDPFSYAHHLRLADILYSSGSYVRARKHYCMCVRLNPEGGNLARCLMCLWMTCVKSPTSEGSASVRAMVVLRLKKLLESKQSNAATQPKVAALKALVLKD